MASITITAVDPALTRILDAFEAVYPGRVAAGMTKNQWITQKIREYVKSVVVAYESGLAAEAARAASAATAETDIVIT